MGRIKTTVVKRTAKGLLDSSELHDSFTEDFDNNKKLLGNSMPSKSIRNKIAGYITRLVRQQKKARLELGNVKQ